MHLYNKDYFEGGTISNYNVYQDSIHFLIIAKEINSLFLPKKALEVGCAKGFIVKYLRHLGVETYGVDISEYATSHAPKKIKKFVSVANANRLPFKNKEFDLVYSVDLLEHIAENELDTVIKEFLRVGRNQFHLITTNEHLTGADETHITLKPIDWWKNKFKEHTEIEELKREVFLVESENHWMYEVLKLHQYKLRYKLLKAETERIFRSKGWKFISFIHNVRLKLTSFIK